MNYNINDEAGENKTDSFSAMMEVALDIYNRFIIEMQDIFGSVSTTIKDNLISEIMILGDLEWCYYEVEELTDSDLLGASPIYLKEYLDNNECASIKDIDEYISKFFTKAIINNVADRTVLNLDTNDIKKLGQAMIDYRAKRYLDCANLLASLIDSQSIKQELFDMDNGRYKIEPINIAQGWKGFYIVFCNNLAKYFDSKSFSKNGGRVKRENGYKNIIQEAKSDLSDYKIQIPILLITSCLFKFFDDSNWKNYPQKPEVINRHWLMHGMYDMDDITKPDCIKLLLMLNQLASIYAKLRNGEL